MNIVVSAKQRKDRGFATACCANKCHGLTCLNLEGNVFQHPLIGDVAEPHVFEFDFTLDFVKFDGVFTVNHVGLHIKD